MSAPDAPDALANLANLPPPKLLLHLFAVERDLDRLAERLREIVIELETRRRNADLDLAFRGIDWEAALEDLGSSPPSQDLDLSGLLEELGEGKAPAP